MKTTIAVLAAGVLMGALIGAQAKLPPPTPKSDVEKKAEADKAAATKAKDAADLAKTQDKAVANFKKNHAAMGKK